MSQNPWRTLAAAALVALMLVSPWAALARAEELAPAEETGSWGKFFDYALCAVSIASATTVVGGVMAAVTCGKVAYTWWTT